MVKSTQFYEQNTKNGMKLRSGKAINCMLSTTICSQIENICYHNDNYTSTYKYRAFKKRDCLNSSCCCWLNKFIYTLMTHYNTISRHPRFLKIYNMSQKKIKEFIVSLETGALERYSNVGRGCVCKDLYLPELKKLNEMYNQPPKYLRDMYFRLAGVMNKDVARNIIDMVSKKR